VDLFPTLTELALGESLPPCPSGAAQLKTALCTMGKSLVPLMKGAKTVAAASFFQCAKPHIKILDHLSILNFTVWIAQENDTFSPPSLSV